MPVINSRYREAGRPNIDEESCSRCGACAAICPAQVLRMEDGRVRVADDSPFGCITCGHCMMVCESGSVHIEGRGAALTDLRPLPPKEERATAQQLEALMLGRRSVRRFTPQEVEISALKRIVEAAATAPMGIPPWDVGCTIVAGRDKVREVAAEVVKGYEGFLKIFRPWLLGAMRPFIGQAKYEQFRNFIVPLAKSYVKGSRTGRDLLFYDAPALILFSHSPYADPVDASIACTYAMLAAETLGLGTTMIGGAPPIMQRNRKLCDRLGIPADFTPSLALIVGHPSVEFRHAIRRNFAFVSTVS